MENSTNSGDLSFGVVCAGTVPHDDSIAPSFTIIGQAEVGNLPKKTIEHRPHRVIATTKRQPKYVVSIPRHEKTIDFYCLFVGNIPVFCK